MSAYICLVKKGEDNNADDPVTRMEGSVKNKLNVGEYYYVTAARYGIEENKVARQPIKMRLIHLSKHVARFERRSLNLYGEPYHFTESFSYGELRQVVRG